MVSRSLLNLKWVPVLLAGILICIPAWLQAQTLASLEAQSGRKGFFPGIYFTDVIEAVRKAEDGSPYWVRTETEQEALNRLATDYTSLLLNHDILAYYGHPRSQQMGILGRFSF
jgi:hypothetical protein